MLCRVSCKACHISSLWTDDPKGFLESVCLRYRHCQAKLIEEEFTRPVMAARAKSVATRIAPAKAPSRSHPRIAPAPH
jgi:hypothetical protein